MGCNSQSRYHEEIQANAYLQKHIGRALIQLDTLNLEAFDKSRKTKLDKLVYVEHALAEAGDTLDANTALFLKGLSLAGEPYHPPSVETTRLEARLNRSYGQLEALNHDLKHNLLPKDSVGWLLREERRMANVAIDDVRKTIDKFDYEQLKTEIWVARIDSFIEASINK